MTTTPPHQPQPEDAVPRADERVRPTAARRGCGCLLMLLGGLLALALLATLGRRAQYGGGPTWSTDPAGAAGRVLFDLVVICVVIALLVTGIRFNLPRRRR